MGQADPRIRHQGRVSLSPPQIAAIIDAADPNERLAAIGRVAAAVFGCALFTAMRFDAQANEVERLYSTNPAAYPVGGRKLKRDTAWAEHVLAERRIFVGQG